MGRFINADVFYSTGQGFAGNNMFAYCGNEPIGRSDITGTRYECCFPRDMSGSAEITVTDEPVIDEQSNDDNIYTDSKTNAEQGISLTNFSDKIHKYIDRNVAIVSLGLAVTALLLAVGVISVPVVGQIVLAVAGLVCAVWGIYRLK